MTPKDKPHPSQKTRFAPSRFSTVWDKVVQHLTPPSHPSTTSQSAIDSSFHTDLYYNGSVAGPSSAGRGAGTSLALDLLNPRSGTQSRHKRPGGMRARSRGGKSSVANSTSRYGDDEDNNANPCEPVSHTVVEANFDQFIPSTAKSDSGSTNRTPGASQFPDKDSGGHLFSRTAEEDEGDEKDSVVDGSERQSIRRDRRDNWVKRSMLYEVVVERIWPNIKHFLDSRFPEQAKERSFQKEAWFTQKQGAIACSVFFVISWGLTAGLQPAPFTTFIWVAYYACAGAFTLPLVVLVMMDQPRRRPWLWQPFLFCATWVLADILIIEMYRCHFFSVPNTCGSKNFLNTMGFAFSQPTLAILAMRQSRVFAAIGAAQWLVLTGALVMSQDGTPNLFSRNMVNFALFHAFLIGTNFLKERSDRQMFALRQQLKIQYRATQSAQVMERRASDSKKRFVSYIFHEVRVPLNTALLAVQNLEGENVFKGLHDDQAEMVHGLMGSLTMMEKVLNDVLSFNRMESGKFVQARKPFEFHKSIQLVALSHRMQAQMAGIDLIVDLDPHIDRIGGVFLGDEMRLRQVASNLVSNSIKFTETGSVRIVTKLLFPRMEPTPAVEMDDPLRQAAVNSEMQQQIEAEERAESGRDLEKGVVGIEHRRQSRDSTKEKEEMERRKRKAVIRVEIHDTGVGLKKQDVIDNRLFSPYVQTEIGRRQGGKGSGLGLALVRQIVKLSNGRLGVESEVGKGSMFWFELPYSLPPPPKSRSRETSKDASSPFLMSSPSFGAGTLGKIVEVPTPSDIVERPEMRMTDSELPLLPRRTAMSVPEDSMVTTYPPVDETPSDTTLIDPFQASGSAGRRSSDLSQSQGQAAETSVKGAAKEIQQHQEATPAPPSPLPSPEGPLCTLVVDDDRLTRMLMSRMLTRLGHQVTTAENGKLALDLIRKSFTNEEGTPSFDVVFLDNQMPLMSGVEVARAVREMRNPLYIVGCTGNALREDQEEYLGAGADGIIPKPIHQKAVLEMIKEARRRIKGETRPRDLEMESPGVGPLGMGQEQGMRFDA